MTAPTPEQADEIPDAYARYIRATFPPEVLVNAPNEITGRWKHMTGPAEREFWRSLDAQPAADPDVPASPEQPVYRKLHQGDDSATRMFMITCDEGWRLSIVCADVYEHVADWLLPILGRKPYATTPGQETAR